MNTVAEPTPGEADYRVLFVCLGNTCRSPLAEGLLREKLKGTGLLGRVALDSAGTWGGNAGRPPDPRARLVAARHGFTIADLRARRFRVEDFDAFDSILVFDADNRLEVLDLARDDDDRSRVSLIDADADVADPVAGPLPAFERAYGQIDRACDRLVGDIRARLDRY